jgi:hypothetical protein
MLMETTSNEPAATQDNHRVEDMVWIAATHRNYDVAIGDATDLEQRQRILHLLSREESGQPPLSQQEDISYEPRSVATRPDSGAIMVGTKSGTLHYYEFDAEKQTFIARDAEPFPSAKQPKSGHGAIRGCCFLTPDLVAFTMRGTLRIYQRESSASLFSQKLNHGLSEFQDEPEEEPGLDGPLGVVRGLVPLTTTPTFSELLILYNGQAPSKLVLERTAVGWTPKLQALHDRCPLCGCKTTPSTSALVDATWKIVHGERTTLYGLFDDGALKLQRLPGADGRCDCEQLPTLFRQDQRYQRLAVRGDYLALLSDDEVCIISSKSYASATHPITKPLRHDIWFPQFSPEQQENEVWIYVSSVGRGVETIGFRYKGETFDRVEGRNPRHPRHTGSVLQLGIIEPSPNNPILYRVTQDHQLLFSSIMDKNLLEKFVKGPLIARIKQEIETSAIKPDDEPTQSAWLALGKRQRKLLCGPVAWVCMNEMLREAFTGKQSTLSVLDYVRWDRAEILSNLEAEDLRRFTNTIFYWVLKQVQATQAYDRIAEQVLDWTHSLLDRARTISNDLEIEVANLIMNQIFTLRNPGWSRLWAFGGFLRKWIDRGYTYGQKRTQHLELHQWNKTAEHHLDALCYLSYLRHRRFDLLWEVPLYEWEGDVSSWAVEHTQIRPGQSDTAVDVFFQSCADGSLRAVLLTNATHRRGGRLTAVLKWDFDAAMDEATKAVARACVDTSDEWRIRRPEWPDFHDYYQHGPFTRAIAVLPASPGRNHDQPDERTLIISWQGWRSGDQKQQIESRPMLVALRICVDEKHVLRIKGAAYQHLETELFCLLTVPPASSAPKSSIHTLLAGTSGQLKINNKETMKDEWRRIPLLQFEVDTEAPSIRDPQHVGGRDQEGQRSYVRTGDPSPGVTVDPCTSMAVSPVVNGEQRLWAGFRDGEIRSYTRKITSSSDGLSQWSPWVAHTVERLLARSRIVRLQYFSKTSMDSSTADGILCYGTLDGVFGAMTFDKEKSEKSIHIFHAKEQSTITSLFQFSQTPAEQDSNYLAYITHSGAISIFWWHKGSKPGSLRRTGRIQAGVSSWHALQIMLPTESPVEDAAEPARPAVVLGCDDGALRCIEILLIHDPLVPESGSRAEAWKLLAQQLFTAATGTDLSILPLAKANEGNPSHDALSWLPLLRVGSLSLTVFAFERQIEQLREWMTDPILRDSSTSSLKKNFQSMRMSLRSIERAAVAVRPLDIAPARAIWSLVGAACRDVARAAWDAYWRQDRTRTEFLITQYEELVSGLEVYCNQWIGRDFAEKSEVLIHSFQAVFSAFDVLMLAWRTPGRANSSLRNRMVLSFLARRLHFSPEQVPLETLRVLNDAIEDAIIMLHAQLFCEDSRDFQEWTEDMWQQKLGETISLRPEIIIDSAELPSAQVPDGQPQLPQWAELKNSGFYDLMTIVGDVARSRLTAHEHTDPFHTGIARFFGLCLVLFPHASLNVGQVIAESGLLRKSNPTFVDYTRNQANATLRRIADTSTPPALKRLIESKLDLVKTFLSTDAQRHIKEIGDLAATARSRAVAYYAKVNGDREFPWAQEKGVYVWSQDIARWTRPFSDDALVLEYNRILTIISYLEHHDHDKPTVEYAYYREWATETNKSRPSRYFAHSCRVLVELMCPKLEEIRGIMQRPEPVVESEKNPGNASLANTAAETLREQLRRADLFEPSISQYDQIVLGWIATINKTANKGARLFHFFERINRHVYRVGSDDAMAAIVELVLQRMPTLFDESTDKSGSITSVLEDRLERMPEAWVIRDVFKYCHQLVQQTHMTGMLFSVSRMANFSGFGGHAHEPDYIKADRFKQRVEEAGKLRNLEVEYRCPDSSDGDVPKELHLSGFELVWKVILDEFATNVYKYGSTPVPQKKPVLYCRVGRDNVRRVWTVMLAGNRPFAEHVPADRVDWSDRQAVERFIKDTVMEFGCSASANKDSSGVGMPLIEAVGRYVGLNITVCLEDLSQGKPNADAGLDTLPLCLSIESSY